MRFATTFLRELVAARARTGAACVGARILTDDGGRIEFDGGTMNFYGHGAPARHGDGAAAHESDSEPRDTLFASGGAMLVDRAAFLAAGGFDEDYFAYFEDVDLGWRLWVLGERCVHAPAARAYHREHASEHLLAPGRRMALLERNALLSVYKNYEEERGRRVFACALALIAERARLEPSRREACERGALEALAAAARGGAPPARDRGPAPPSGSRDRAAVPRALAPADRRRRVRRAPPRPRRGLRRRRPAAGGRRRDVAARRGAAGMRLTRRQLCRGGALAGLALLARPALGGRAAALAQAPATPSPAATAARVSSAETVELLREMILQRALASTDPWVQAHVVLALGAGVESGGKPVIDAMVAQSLRTEAVELKKYPFFPTDLERHPFHFLQILQATDVPYERVFVTPLGRFTRREIVSGSEALLDPKEITDELSWLVSVLTHEFPQDRDTFKTARGLEVRVTEIVQRHLRETDAAYADTFASMAGATPYARGAIHRSACNGTHMLYGLIDALRAGYTVGQLRAHTERLVRALLFRMRAEPQADRRLAALEPPDGAPERRRGQADLPRPRGRGSRLRRAARRAAARRGADAGGHAVARAARGSSCRG